VTHEPLSVRVALVEDHPIFREGLRLVLHSDPSIELVGEAGNAEEALRLAERARPDVMLVDIGLRPGPNGIALTRALRKKHPDIRVLILSVEDRAEYVRSAHRAGARGYAMKADAPRMLIAAIHAVAAGGSFWPPSVDLSRSSGSILTPTELQVSRHLADGLQNRQVADRMGITVRTVESHRASSYERLGVSSAIGIRERLEAEGLLDPNLD